MNLKFWGQAVDDVGDSTWMTTVKKTHYEKGKPASVGLNEKLIKEAIKKNITLAVRIDSLDKTIFVTAKDFRSKSWVHKQPSIVKPGTTFDIFMLPVSEFIK